MLRSAEECLKLLEARYNCQVHLRYKLVIIDMNMPGMSGACTSTKIKDLRRNFGRQTNGEKLTLCSGDDIESIPNETIRLFDHALRKPLVQQELLKIII